MAKLPSGWILIPKSVNNGTAIEIEQRELITCKECKYFERDIPDYNGSYNGCSVWLTDGDECAVVNEDWFCSNARRREDA